MTGLVGYLLLFLLVGAGFILLNLLVGKLIRPARALPEKSTVYECGEPAIGSAWVQFDLRFYVVALLFVIFDVEVAFFFPWAVVFGQANAVARGEQSADAQVLSLVPAVESVGQPQGQPWNALASLAPAEARAKEYTAAARQYAWLAFFDILVFFGVLLVGFAYVWARGDIKWVRSLAAEEEPLAGKAAPSEAGTLVGAGR
jgi:NADH-quinone oxidoreductase subunit A